MFTTVAVIQSSGGRGGPIEVQTVSPSIESLSSELIIPGSVELLDVQVVYLEAEKGDQYELLVEDGEAVEPGTPLVQYSSRQLELEKEQLELQIEAGYLRINQIEKQEKDLDKKEEELRKELSKKRSRGIG